MVDLDYRLENITEDDDRTYSLTFKDSDGNAIDITNWTVWMTIKKDIGATDGEAVIQKEVTSHDDPTNGKTSVKLEDIDTDGLGGFYFYDFQITDGNGDKYTILKGQVGFEQGITDS